MKWFSEKERLKRRAKRQYRAMMHKLDSVDCGASMLRTISPSFAAAENGFIRTMHRLAAIDPEARETCRNTSWIGLPKEMECTDQPSS